MPSQRLIRDWTASEKIEKLTFQSEVLLIRIMMKADDHGSFHANPKLINSFCFPLKNIRETDITRWLQELVTAGLIVLYTADSKQYLNILNFGQRLRTKKSEFPFFDSNLRTIDSNPPPEVEVEVEVEGEGEGGRGWNTNPVLKDVGDLPEINMQAVKQRVYQTKGFLLTDETIKSFWELWKVEKLTGKKYYASIEDVYSHFSNTAKDEPFKKPEERKSINTDNKDRLSIY